MADDQTPRPGDPADARRLPTHETVLEHVEHLLTTGTLVPGDRLPSERVLAEQLGVSRPAVREALKVLAVLGVVRSSPGRGRESAPVVVARPGAAMGAALRIHAATATLGIADLVETRVLLEAATVRALAARVSSHGAAVLDQASALVDAMAEPGVTTQEFHRLDAAFHVALADAAGNSVIAVVMGALREAIQAYVLAAVPGLPDWGATADGLRAEHAALLDALRAGDGDTAADRVAGHIRGFFAATHGTSDL